ncbi:MAG: hypothetical protein DMD47_03015 [Gemmatimonadetes bacterium]|nr:MAG: hypothetical protein DMD47_03015 [Gemmatimonadota bacterium]
MAAARGRHHALLRPRSLGRPRGRGRGGRLLRHRTGPGRPRLSRHTGQARAGLPDPIGEWRRGACAGPAVGVDRRRGVAPAARPPAGIVRRRGRRALAVRSYAAARDRLGAQPRDAHRGGGPARSGSGVRDAPRRPAGLPAAQSRGAQDGRPTGRHRVRRHHLLAAHRDSRGASRSAAVKARVLGRTGLRVGELGFGAWAIGGNQYGNSYGPTDDAEAKRAIRRAYELGCNFFDTADVYGHGHSEELLGEALADVRHDVILATKVGGNFYNRDVHSLVRDRLAQALGKPLDRIPEGAPLPVTHDANFTAPYVRFAAEQSLRRLRTDCIDLLQLHNPPLNLISRMETYEALEDLKREGKIRFYGVSVHPPEEGLAVIHASLPHTVQIVYNLARREAEVEFLPAARAANIGVIAREPLANGLLAGKYAADAAWSKGDIRGRMPRSHVAQLTALGQRVRELAQHADVTAAQLALKFVLDNEAVSVVIVGMKTVAQVDENLSAGR